MPWDLIRTLISETYGGKIDNDADFQQLRQLVATFMTPSAFDDDHRLVKADDAELIVPGGTSMKGFVDWVNMLPEREPPTYLGLPANAEKLLLVGHGKTMIENLGKIREILDEGEQLMAEETAA
jgi:dynein heavy chain 1